jgi:ribosomal-protein-alanine N-acetyltransferase
MAVRRDHQRHGIGRALLEELLAIARRSGARHTLLEVAADNLPAQALYDSYGFEVIGLRKNYYQASGTDALVMRRSES